MDSLNNLLFKKSMERVYDIRPVIDFEVYSLWRRKWIVSQIFKLLPKRHSFFDLVIGLSQTGSMLSFVFSRSDCQLKI